MKSVYILGILLIAVFILWTYQSYSLNNLYNDSQIYEEDVPIIAQKYDKNIDYSRMPAQPGQLRVSSQPDGNAHQTGQCDSPTIHSSVPLYQEDEDMQPSNKGFVNELIYKPPASGNLPYAPALIENTVPLNSPLCQLSTDLPIANINVNYFLDKNTTKLRT
jgi:hypothetical protein